MTSIEDQQSTVKALHNQTFALYDQLIKHLGPSTPKGQAEQIQMDNFFGSVPRIAQLPSKAFNYDLKIKELMPKIPQSVLNGICTVPRTTGRRGAGSLREVTPGRFLASNGTMHGQSNAVNSPASSVQNPSASSQHVIEFFKKRIKR